MKPSMNEKKSVDIARYAKLREAAQNLLHIMELENTTYDEKIRILNAIMEITKMSKEDDNIRKSLISDVIHEGVLRHYFAESKKPQAEDILNETTIESQEEETLYKLNFLIPDDRKFVTDYKNNNKSIVKMKKIYDIPDAMVISSKLVEVAKYSEAYRDYLENNDMEQPDETSIPPELEVVEESSEEDDLLARLDEIEKQKKAELKEQLKKVTEEIEKQEEPIDITFDELPEDTIALELREEPKMTSELDNEIPPFLKRYMNTEKTKEVEEPEESEIDEISELIACAEKGLHQLRSENKKKDELIEKHNLECERIAETIRQEYEAKLAKKEIEINTQSDRIIAQEKEISELKKQIESLENNNKKLLSFVKLVSKELDKA